SQFFDDMASRDRERSVSRGNGDSFAMTTYPFDSIFSPFEQLSDLIPSSIWRSSWLAPHHNRAGRSASASFWSPRVNINESDSAYQVNADLPGVNRDDIKLDIDQGKLRIQGHRRHEAEHEENGWHVKECSSGKFMRTVLLPENVDANNITAKSENGVLNITIPKTSASQTKSIPIS
ncbi:hypothetical protein EV182_006275, partial [Spiromyces aspiralis]